MTVLIFLDELAEVGALGVDEPFVNTLITNTLVAACGVDTGESGILLVNEAMEELVITGAVSLTAAKSKSMALVGSLPSVQSTKFRVKI